MTVPNANRLIVKERYLQGNLRESVGLDISEESSIIHGEGQFRKIFSKQKDNHRGWSCKGKRKTQETLSFRGPVMLKKHEVDSTRIRPQKGIADIKSKYS
jgi:DNA helicase TIP49 (TBP-interacting protein)